MCMGVSLSVGVSLGLGLSVIFDESSGRKAFIYRKKLFVV